MTASQPRYNRRAIMQMASILLKGRILATWKECMKSAWAAAKALVLKAELATKTVKFTFLKKSDGTVRLAYGTTMSEVVSAYPFVGKETKSEAKLIRFLDTEINEWRCCSIDNIIKIY